MTSINETVGGSSGSVRIIDTSDNMMTLKFFWLENFDIKHQIRDLKNPKMICCGVWLMGESMGRVSTSEWKILETNVCLKELNTAEAAERITDSIYCSFINNDFILLSPTWSCVCTIRVKQQIRELLPSPRQILTRRGLKSDPFKVACC